MAKHVLALAEISEVQFPVAPWMFGAAGREHMKRYGRLLGRNITFHEVPDGMHDLTLSRKDVRDRVLDTMVAWADEVMG